MWDSDFVLKISLWIFLSLIFHVAFALVFLKLGNTVSAPLNEDIVDLTVVAPAAISGLSTPAKATAVAPPRAATPKASVSSTTTNSASAANNSNPESVNSVSAQGSADGEPVAWGEVTQFPRVAKEIKATFPAEAKKAGVDGAVVADILIDRLGKVRHVEIISGPGYGLNESALEALKQFEFHPAKKGEQSVAVKIRYTYRFKLGVN